jgi:hypothetical protein
MEPWEKQLLQHMEILVLMETITHQPQQQLIIASDGSVQDHRAAFGWIITTTGGIRIAKCSGPAYGYKPSSYRAEGYVLLSVIRFLHTSQKKWGWQSTSTIICDNKAIVQILQVPIKQEDTYPSLAISAEWDILSEIRTTLDHNMMRSSIQFQHIKGHADKDKPYTKLSLMQQLNVDADRLANEYIHQHQDDKYNIVPLLPTSGIQLNMEGGTVTYHLKKTVMQV